MAQGNVKMETKWHAFVSVSSPYDTHAAIFTVTTTMQSEKSDRRGLLRNKQETRFCNWHLRRNSFGTRCLWPSRQLHCMLMHCERNLANSVTTWRRDINSFYRYPKSDRTKKLWCEACSFALVPASRMTSLRENKPLRITLFTA